MIKILWNDPVWSKVIAGVILAALAGFGTYLLNWWPVIYRCLKEAKNKIRNRIWPQSVEPTKGDMVKTILAYSEEDCKAVLSSWLGSRDSSLNTQVIHFADVDNELGFTAGTTKKYIKIIAQKLHYSVEHEGEQTILFREEPLIINRPSRGW